MKNLLSFSEFVNESRLNEADLVYDGGRNGFAMSHTTPIAGEWDLLQVTLKLFKMSIGYESVGVKAIECKPYDSKQSKIKWKFVRIISGKYKGVCYIIDDKTDSIFGEKNETLTFPGKSLGSATIEIQKISDKDFKSIFDELVDYTSKIK